MSEIERLRELLRTLTECCAPGPWHGVESGNDAAFAWWLDNEAGDSSFPTPDDVAAMLNALPALLDVAEAARRVATFDPAPFEEPDAGWIFQSHLGSLRAALARLARAS